jgi:hypothetical protein
MQILTKRESTDGYKNGRFGNHLRQWDTPDEALNHNWDEVGIRYRGKGSNGPVVPCTPKYLRDEWTRLVVLEGYRPSDLYLSERCPDDKLTFQGEICEAPHVGGYALHYSLEKTIQRMALRMPTSVHERGPRVKLLCKQFMDADSYDDLLTLLDLYPLHTIEFSCFSVRLGNLRRNTIFWEVRNC